VKQLENLGLYGMTILKWIFKNWVKEGKEWDYLAQNRDKCLDFVNEVMDFLFHKMQGFPWLDEEPLASQKGQRSMK